MFQFVTVLINTPSMHEFLFQLNDQQQKDVYGEFAEWNLNASMKLQVPKPRKVHEVLCGLRHLVAFNATIVVCDVSNGERQTFEGVNAVITAKI